MNLLLRWLGAVLVAFLLAWLGVSPVLSAAGPAAEASTATCPARVSASLDDSPSDAPNDPWAWLPDRSVASCSDEAAEPAKPLPPGTAALEARAKRPCPALPRSGGCPGCLSAVSVPEVEQAPNAVSSPSPANGGECRQGRGPWLARHQGRDGGWGVWQGLDACGHCCTEPGHSPGDSEYDVARTALALLCFFEEGHTHRFGRHKRKVNKGLRWLRDRQLPSGWVGVACDAEVGFYNHALGSLALSLAYAISRDFTLKKPAERAARATARELRARDSEVDPWTEGWALLALRESKAVARLDLDGASLPAPRAPQRPAEATALDLCRWLLAGGSRREPWVQRAAERLAAERIRWTEFDGHRWLFTTVALFYAGGKPWNAWRKPLTKVLLERQRQDGCEAGTWDPIGPWGAQGGRLSTTVLCCLMLGYEYRHQRRVVVNAYGQ